ncbi:MAG: hypothetical protein K2X27_05015 [Candidatus Obscuribacterales bacterium]|nr:hypothetical protein [Candidatus Obscuribacterales bacterium]
MGRITVIAPRMPPRHDGLGAYVVQLWQSIFSDYSETSSLDISRGWSFLLMEAADQSQELFPKSKIKQMPKTAVQLAAELETLESEKVILQFVGYGFDRKRGIAAFLAEGLKIWLNGQPNRRLFIMFHELWVDDAKFWQRTYWNAILQKRTVAELLSLAKVSVTSNEYYVSRLQSLCSTAKITVIPIGSNFQCAPAPVRDWKCLSIFGLTRLHCIKQHANLLNAMSRNALLNTIVLAGSTRDKRQNEEKALIEKLCPGVSIQYAYDFDLNQVPENLKNCGLALMDVHSQLLAKSGRFQIACALGQVPIASHSSPPGSPLIRGENFFDYNPENTELFLTELKDESALAEISTNSLKLSNTYFSWSNIAKLWTDALDV